MKLLPRSLQGRLLALVLGAVTAVWLAALALTWRDAQHELDELLDSHLAQAAALLVVRQAEDLADDDAEGGLDAPLLHRYATRTAFQVWHGGRLVLRSAQAPAHPMSDRAQGFATVTLDGRPWRVFVAHGAEHDVQVQVGEQLRSRGAILRALLHSLLWPLLGALPLLALAVWWAVRTGVAPMRRLGSALARRDPQRLEPVRLDDAPTEMQPMLDALNGLFGRIAVLIESERRFTADAAHELRTPIAAIRAQAQVALAEADEARRRHALQATLAGCDRATRLVEQLLTLARLEAGQPPAQSPLDLGALVRRVAAELAERALDKQQALELDAGPAACRVAGDETLLGVLVRNLLDNAIRYSPRGARLRLGLQPRGPEIVLRVEDSGPGLAEPELARLGERFFRVLGSGESGSGLGWSIVRRIAQVHGAQLRVERSEALGGLAVEVAWPAAA